MKKRITLLIMVFLIVSSSVSYASQNDTASYKTIIWLERPNSIWDPGNPIEDSDMIGNYIIYKEETRWAPVGSSVALGKSEGEYLYTPSGKRFAHFIGADNARVNADGSTVINAYYARGIFTYSFEIGNPQAEMSPDGVLYTGNGTVKYTIQGKYEQEVVIPSFVNNLMPINTNKSLPDAVCVGWSLDERTGYKEVLPYSDTISELLLPTDGMPYSGLIYHLKGVWYDNAQIIKTSCWREQLPDEVGLEENENFKVLALNGKMYVNYPATDYYLPIPKGATPIAGNEEGTQLVRTIPPEDGGDLWTFIYDRNIYSLSIDSNGADKINGSNDVKYQQNLDDFDPGWGEGTILTVNGVNYFFDGWYTHDGEFIAFNLGNVWMPAHDLSLTAHWISSE